MTKDELIAYLEAVKAAETAKYFCEKTIRELQEQFEQLSDLPVPDMIENFTFTPPPAPKAKPLPAAPVRTKRMPKTVFHPNIRRAVHMGCIAVTAPCLLFLIFGLFPSLPTFIVAMIAVVFLTGPVGNALYRLLERAWDSLPANKARRDKAAADAAAADDADARADAAVLAAAKAEAEATAARFAEGVKKARSDALAVWKEKKAANDADITAVRQENAARAVLRQLLTREQEYLNKRLELIQRVLDRLYARDIVFEDFRSLVAVSQLLKYLKMGVCSQLEGTHEAYYIYLDDIRADKIVGSISQLENSMKTGIEAVCRNQAATVSILRGISDQLYDLHDMLHHDLISVRSAIAAGFIATGVALDDFHDTVASSARATSASISHLASRTEALTTEWHDYIDRMESSATGYLRGR